MRFASVLLAVLAFGLVPPAHAADPVAGKAIFDSTCHNCHSLHVGVNKVGPSLWHVIGRPSASVPGFIYSDALRSLHTDWTVAAVDNYLTSPRGKVHGAQMYFRGLKNPAERANVIAYLQNQD